MKDGAETCVNLDSGNRSRNYENNLALNHHSSILWDENGHDIPHEKNMKKRVGKGSSIITETKVALSCRCWSW